MTGACEIDERYCGFEVDEKYRHITSPVTRFRYYGASWLIAGHAELLAALRDDDTFSSEHDLPTGSTARVGVMTPATAIRAVPTEVDPPDYYFYRKLLGPWFAPSAVRALRPDILSYTTWCLDRYIEKGSMDLLREMIELVPALTTMRLLGLPSEDSRIVSDAVHARGDDRFDLNPAWGTMLDRISATIADRRRQPREDLISGLLQPGAGGRLCTDAEIAEVCFAVVVGGMSTTAKLVLGALSYFGVHRSDLARARGEPEFLALALEEFLRYYSPVPFLCRTVTRDVTIASRRIRRGERVAMGFAAANRDPHVFSRPHDVVLGRKPNRHVALGYGIHSCVGSSLGRAEASIMIGEVLRRMPDYRILTDYRPTAQPERVTWTDRLRRGLMVGFTPGPRLGGDFDVQLNELPERPAG
jgi:cytochrome P450